MYVDEDTPFADRGLADVGEGTQLQCATAAAHSTYNGDCGAKE